MSVITAAQIEDVMKIRGCGILEAKRLAYEKELETTITKISIDNPDVAHALKLMHEMRHM